MRTAEFFLSKRPVLRFTVALLFLLKLFSSHVDCILKLKYIVLILFNKKIQACCLFYLNYTPPEDITENETGYKRFQVCTALLSLLMMTAESFLSKRPVLRTTVPKFFSS